MANPNSNVNWLRGLLIVAAVFWVFSPALHGDWLMDDDFYLPQNALVKDPHRLWKIWFQPGSQLDYYPIEATVQYVQWKLWGLDQAHGRLGYHLTNLLLHILGSLLVWRVFSQLGLRYAWLGGFLFAVHPAVVESVAWISELKNVLSLPPFLLAISAWIDFENTGGRRDYARALAWFLAAMLCKVSMALFPLVILLYAWWKRRRVGTLDFVHTAPFAAVSLVLGAMTILSGSWFRIAHLESPVSPYIGGFATHVALAGQSLAFYFFKAIVPVNMIPIYPRWDINSGSIWSYAPWVVLIGVLVDLWTRRATWGRHALLGLGFFLLNILPFIGLTTVSYMEFTWVMDHLLYIPIIGIIGLAVAALEYANPRVAAVAAVACALLAAESHAYAAAFAGPEEVWTYTLQRNPDTYIAYNNLGNVMLETGRLPEAVADYEQALKRHPAMIEAHNNLGLSYFQLGRTDDAIMQYELALRYHPHFALAHANLGNALQRQGRNAEAIQHYRAALEADPHNADAEDNLRKLGGLNSPGE